jgi:hypothetical protein
LENKQTYTAMAPLFRFLRNQDPGRACLLAGVFFLPLFLPVAIVCLTAAGVLWLGRLIWTGEVCLHRSPLDLWLAPFAALAALSIPQSAHAAAGWYNYMCLVGLYLLAYFLVVQMVRTGRTQFGWSLYCSFRPRWSVCGDCGNTRLGSM